MLTVFFLATIALAWAEDVNWFLGVKLSETNTEALTQRSCFRGTFGVEAISLFTCTFDGIDGKLFAQLPQEAPLCVVEASNTEAARTIAKKATDTSIIYEMDNILILTSTNFADYPSTCVSRSDYHGAALNVMRVPRQALVPQAPWIPAPIVINPVILGIANSITAAKLQSTVTKLANYVTRNSMSTNATQATRDLQAEWQANGANATLQSFRSGYCSNVIGEVLGTTQRSVYAMIGGHLDSRGAGVNNATQPAPGADDNASGLAIVIELFNAIVANKTRFRKSVRFLAWCGEEQGLYGSDYAAKDSKSKNENIDSYLNCDMLGYKPPSTQSTLGIVDRAVNVPFTAEIRNIVREYYPNLPIGSATACCSDQQSYNTQGFAAGGLFEQAGASVTYPQYHTGNDVPANLNYTQLEMFARAAAVVFLTRADPDPNY